MEEQHTMGTAGGEGQSGEAQFAAILADAAKSYSDTTGGSLDDFMTPTMRSVDDLTHQLDLQNDRFSEFRAKRHTIFGAIAIALKPVELVGDIVSGAASEVFAPSQNIYSAVMYLVNAAHDVSSTYDSIVELFEELKDFTSRLEVYVQHEVSPGLRQKLVDIMASLFEVLVFATKEVLRGRLKAYFKRLFGSDSPVQPALEKLKALTLGEERQVIAETYGGVTHIKTTTDQVHELVSQMNLNFQNLRSENWDQTNLAHQDRLREILEPSPFPEDFINGFGKSRVEGTGDWIIQDEGFQAWLRDDSKYIWINGGPGTGKSFLSARLITWASENLCNLGFFFFRDNNPETRSVLQALRDVAYQLSENDAFYAKQLTQTLHSSEDIKTVSSAYRRLFLEPSGQDSRGRAMHIFLDGIDEADQDDIKILLSQLAPEEGQPQTNVKVALIGRSYLTETVSISLDPASQGHIFNTVHVTPERNAHDVSAFIAQGVSRSRILRGTDAGFKAAVISSMEKQVDGLFILAKFMLAEVNRKRHTRSILESLESYPKEINGMLKRTLTSLSTAISVEEVEDLNEILRWVSCAEETLTLEQLEAALALQFGDPPIRLEEALRRQYSCFFELDREDGFSTDDLVKFYERGHRDSGNGGSQRRRLSPAEKVSPKRSISPSGNLTTGLSSGPTGKRLSPTRQFSPEQSPSRDDPMNEMEFQSSKSTTYVTFFHTSVREFFRDQNSTSTTPTLENATIGFDTGTAKLHILTTCLRIFNDQEWFEKHDLGQGQHAIKQYAAWYWQEHLRSVDPATVSADERRDIGKMVYRMLTEEKVIFAWSIMYEKNNEGLEVLTDRNIDGLRLWMADPLVHGDLDGHVKEWSAKATAAPSSIVREIGRLYAKAWLSDDFEYVPTRFCFNIVQTMAYMEQGQSWSQSKLRWSEIPVEERISQAAKWANCTETAHWHRRLGSTYLIQGLHSKALSHYYQSLKADDNKIESCGRIAYCLSREKRYEDALQQALECASMEEDYLLCERPQGPKLSRSRWRLYKDHDLIGRCYHALGNVAKALEYFQKAMDLAGDADLEPSEKFESAICYLEILEAENRHQEMIDLLQVLSDQAGETKYSESRLVDLLLHQYNQPLVMDWIPRAACKTGKLDMLVKWLREAIATASASRHPLRVLYLRLSLAAACLYNREICDAIFMLEQISLVEYRPHGNAPTRQAHALSFQMLASLYKDRVLQAGLESKDAEEWLGKLEHVQDKQDTHQNLDMPTKMLGSDVNVASIYLALFYRLLGRNEKSRPLLKELVLDSLDILSDGEVENDAYALENLVRLFIAAGDVIDARALAHSMRKPNPKARLATPVDSPVNTRAEPKLPEIQTTSRVCGQCLDIISLSEDLSVCQFCMNTFCTKCLDGIIKQAGNQTSDHKEAVACRSDHEWFTVPPLNRLLHTGEILLGDGQVQAFGAWKDMLRRRWESDSPV